MTGYRRLIRMLPIALLGGCALNSSPPANFYFLAVPAPLAETPVAGPTLALGIGPVAIPEMLNRPQIVTRAGDHRLLMADFHRWGGDLQDNIKRLLAEQVGARLQTGDLAIYPWPRNRRLDYQLRVDVLSLQGRLGGEALLQGTWFLSRDDEDLLARPFRLVETVRGDGYADLVAAYSNLFGRLAGDMAASIRPPTDASQQPAADGGSDR